jgi:hypothetical protein
MPRRRILLLYAISPDNSTFSYQRQWPRHFEACPAFECTSIDVADRAWQQRLRAGWLAHSYGGDVIIVLHSVFSNANLAPEWLTDALGARPQPKVYFIGNEYKLMPEKMAFCDRLRLSLLISQSQSPAVHAMYRERLGCAVTGIPNTGLDTAMFSPTQPIDERPIDIGYRADDAPKYLGHRERREIAEFFQARADHYGLRVDLSLRPQDRFDESGWARFLNQCKGQLGTEAGGDFFTLDDGPRNRVLAYESAHPGATFEEVFEQCLRDDHTAVPLRIMSGRHVEAAGTGTVQILFEGDYDGFLQPDEHYIPLRKDFSNADEAVAKFGDRGNRARIAANALQLAREHFTYDRLLTRVSQAIAPLV